MTRAPDTETRVRRLIAEHLGAFEHGIIVPREFEWTDRLTDMGADSLDMVELALKLEEEFGVTVSDDAAFGWRTAGDVFRSVGVTTDA